MLKLHGGLAVVRHVGDALLALGWLQPDPANATVKADTIDRGIFDARIVDIGHPGVAHVVDTAVVAECTVVPIATLIADARITKSIVNPAVIANMRTPVAAVPGIARTAPAPIAGSPQSTDKGCRHPGAGHPVVVTVASTPGPISRCPHVAVARHDRLRVNRQCRRRNSD